MKRKPTTIAVDAYIVGILKSSVRADVEWLAVKWSDSRLPEVELALERTLALVRIINDYEHPKRGKRTA